MRRPDWAERFERLVAERFCVPFGWGRQDCCMWAADCVLAVTGHDPAAPFRGRYATELGAARILARHGGMAGLGDVSFGPQIRPLAATVGDVGLVTNQGRDVMVVCAGAHWLGTGPEGLTGAPTQHVWRAWRCHN